MRGSRATAVLLLLCCAHVYSSTLNPWTAKRNGGLHGSDSCPEDSVLTDDGHCKCVPTCPKPICRSEYRPVQVRPAIPETPGSCCPLYDCVRSESVSLVDSEDDADPEYCIYEGISRKIGERWQPSVCKSCICEEKGFVSCQMSMCKSCENAIPPEPGECCPQCPPLSNTTLHRPDVSSCRSTPIDCNLKCDHGYVRDQNDCPICMCAKWKDDDVAETPPAFAGDAICPKLLHCGLNCELMKDDGGCSVCACQQPHQPSASANGSDSAVVEESQRKICPEVKCNLHCEHGLVMDENDCTFCECKTPHSTCSPLVGCKKKCTYGYKTNKRGCPICRCRASCMDHLNETHPEGSTWHPNACTNCTCDAGGRLNCKETVCSVACNDPLPPGPGTCCPFCPITNSKENETTYHTRGWGTVPITLIVVLTLLCLLLIVHIVRNRFRGRLSPSDATYGSYPPQYYKCVPVYDTPVHRNEKIVPL